MIKNKRLYDQMKKAGFDILLLCEGDNVAYATGYDVPLSYGASDAIIKGPYAYAIVDARVEKTALVVCDWAKGPLSASFEDELFLYETANFFKRIDSTASQKDTLEKALKKYTEDAKVIGVEFMRLPAGAKDILTKVNPLAEIKDCAAMIEDSRVIKQDYEIERIRHSCMVETVGQRRYNKFATDFHGETEAEVYCEVYRAMIEAHGSRTTLTGDFSTGPRINDLSGVGAPTNRKIEVGDPGIFDMSTRIDGYFCDCANTVIFGAKPNEEQAKMFKVVKSAFDAAFKELYPGNKLYNVDKAASDAFRAAGMDPVVYTGHQIGTNVNDFPWLYCETPQDIIIQPNMVVCIEPQNYTHDAGKTGVRLERVVHVTENGPVALTDFEWGMECY